MPRQERISVPKSKEPTPEGHDCEWCPDPATSVVQMHRKTGKGYLPLQKYMYACQAHQHIAKNYAYPP